MDPDSPHRLQELYCDPSWLSLNPLTKGTVLDYFSRSPFFIPGASLEREGVEPAPQSLSGGVNVSYSLRPVSEAEERAGVFTISRLQNGVCVGMYTCLGGTIIQCPPLESLISSRVGRASVHLEAALKTLAALEELEGMAAGGTR
jgi:hypothetical protein